MELWFVLYLFADTVIEFNDVKAWKISEVGNKPKFRSRYAVVMIKSARLK